MGDELAGLNINAWVAWAESDEPTRSGVDVFGGEASELGAAVIRRAFAGDGSDGRVM